MYCHNFHLVLSDADFSFARSSMDLTCKRGSVGQSEGLSIPRSSVRFRLKPDTSNSHEFELHRPSIKGTKLLLKVLKAIIIYVCNTYIRWAVCINDILQYSQICHSTCSALYEWICNICIYEIYTYIYMYISYIYVNICICKMYM